MYSTILIIVKITILILFDAGTTKGSPIECYFYQLGTQATIFHRPSEWIIMSLSSFWPHLVCYVILNITFILVFYTVHFFFVQIKKKKKSFYCIRLNLPFVLFREFSICYRVLDDCAQETFLPLLSDYELDAAIQE